MAIHEVIEAVLDYSDSQGQISKHELEVNIGNKLEEYAQQSKPSVSDEEIEKWVKEHGYYGSCTSEYHEGLEEGAKWVRDKK